MAAPGSPDRIIPPTQVWSTLTTDLRRSVVWLVAQLAVTVATAKPHPEEVSHACIQPEPENPA